MTVFRIALLQLLSEGTMEGNLKKGIEYCRQAKKMGADLALFPEMWSTGYRIHENIDRLKKSATESDGEFVRAFRVLAKELDMSIGITYLERNEPLPRNTLTLIDRFGIPVLTYAKVHTCVFGEERRLAAGEDFYVVELDTKAGTIKVGVMICFDREFPESARILMLKGAEIILVPNACPMEINRLSQLRARAFENMVGIATANYAYGQADCNGHSTAFDGMAYGETRLGETESRDMLVVEAGESESICMASFPIDKIREYRENEVHGNAYRRPAQYHPLISEVVEKPFIRFD